MKIPVFVSCPTQLTAQQNRVRKALMDIVEGLQLEPRALGRSDYPKDVPLKEVYAIARHCHGGILLGFEQFRATNGCWKPGTKEEKHLRPEEHIAFPTPWNQLEGGILFGLKLPLLIFRQNGVSGGLFDIGTSEVFVHTMPANKPDHAKSTELNEIFLKWYAEVSRHYYQI